ncbi:MAG: hypothetical protein ABJP66_07705 [Hyphomicrobiales bacterium]|uniref:hypothetical protein n=1 Tax=Shimia thalassica TaxID=1715693 RepID=UPI003297E658
MTEKTDFELGHDLGAQKTLLTGAYESGNDAIIENALARVASVRRMKKNGTLDWQPPVFEF